MLNKKVLTKLVQLDLIALIQLRKAGADHLVRSYHKTFNLKTIITHSSNNFGERQHPEKLIPLSILQLLQGNEIQFMVMGQM